MIASVAELGVSWPGSVLDICECAGWISSGHGIKLSLKKSYPIAKADVLNDERSYKSKGSHQPNALSSPKIIQGNGVSVHLHRRL